MIWRISGISLNLHYPKEDDGEPYTACPIIKGLRGIKPLILYPKEESGSHCLLILDLKPRFAGLIMGSIIKRKCSAKNVERGHQYRHRVRLKIDIGRVRNGLRTRARFCSVRRWPEWFAGHRNTARSSGVRLPVAISCRG